MNHWIVNHHYSSYIDQNNFIGIPAKINKISGEPIRDDNGNMIPKLINLGSKISIGDKFAYYCPAPKKAIIGLFEIIEGPGEYVEDWKSSIHFKIRPMFPIKEENYVTYKDLVQNLNFFKDSEGNVFSSHAAPMKLKGTLKEIDKDDYEIIEKLLLESSGIPIKGLEETEVKETEIKSSLHIKMISQSHLQANQYQCLSYIAPPEYKRVKILDPDDKEVEIMDLLPSWLSDISTGNKTLKRIKNIDNIWFFEESEGFYIPFAVFEHEKDGNLRGVMDRFSALDLSLNSNKRFANVDPLYFLIAKDSKQAETYEKQIESHGEWQTFQKRHQFHIYPIEHIEKSDSEYVSSITQHLVDLSKN